MVTEFVLLELADAFSSPADRSDFLAMDEYVRATPASDIIPTSSDLPQLGRELFAARPDKAWSLTDCTSFVVMQESGITDALTTDRHFAQAGFRVLLGDEELRNRRSPAGITPPPASPPPLRPQSRSRR